MSTISFTMGNEREATALVSYFADCGVSASRKGLVVKANGEPKLLSYLFDTFIKIALV